MFIFGLINKPPKFSKYEIFLLGLGLIIAFFTAWIAVKIFLRIVEIYGFKYFGYYRIIIGIIFLLLVK